MNIRLLEQGDAEPLIRFLRAVPDEDRNFFKEDISDPEVAAGWLNDPRATRLIGVDDDGEIVAELAVVRGIGRSSHVGELELIVAPSHRRRGYGRVLAERGLVEAVSLGLTLVCVQVAAEQVALVEMFARLGFEPEALLRDFIRDRSGETHDLIVLTHHVEQAWSEMLSLGIA